MRSMEQVPVAEKTIRMTTTFGGYNHREIISDGECFDMQNMSAEMYPAMGTRRKRGITESAETLNGIAGRSELVLIRGEKVYYGEEDTGLEVSTDEAMLPKKIVSLGAYVCIWPDKVFFNTINQSDYGSMERKLTTAGTRTCCGSGAATGRNGRRFRRCTSRSARRTSGRACSSTTQ